MSSIYGGSAIIAKLYFSVVHNADHYNPKNKDVDPCSSTFKIHQYKINKEGVHKNKKERENETLQARIFIKPKEEKTSDSEN